MEQSGAKLTSDSTRRAIQQSTAVSFDCLPTSQRLTIVSYPESQAAID